MDGDENPFRFSSEYADDETGLVYYNYRYYSPQLGRWTKRDPIEEKGGVNLYGFIMNEDISAFDSLGLANVCCDNADLEWYLRWLRHCEISDGDCPPGRQWVSYPIEKDDSNKRRMDNGKRCSCVTDNDIKECMRRHPYSAGKGRWGSNCQTSVIKTIASCCLKTSWKPNIYAGNPRGKCLEYKINFYFPYGAVRTCIKWEYPKWQK